MEQNLRRRGRPPSFERGAVVRRAQTLFWSEGAGASLDALSDVTGLHKPSLYAAFGGKRGLYLAALDDYLDEMGRRTGEALGRRPLRAALQQFFATDLEVFCGDQDARGCFLMGTAIDAAAADPEVRQRVERAFGAMRAAVFGRVANAIEIGDLPKGSNSELLTDLICSTHVSLSVEARAGTPRGELDAKVLRLVDFLSSL
jgi:AcrR family transcriptional regulator